MTDLRVRVTAQTRNAWVFTTSLTHHYFDGTVMFIATDAGNGNVTFSITASANWTSKTTEHTLGPLILGGESSTWSNLLDTAQGYCGLGGVH